MTSTPGKNAKVKTTLWISLSVLAAIFLSGCDPEEVDQGPAERCATTSPSENKRAAIERSQASIAETTFTPRAAGSVEVPVFFHIITNDSGTVGNVSEETINRQIQVLNDAFAGRGAGGTGAPTPFKFRLEGFKKIQNSTWFKMKYREDTPTQEEVDAKKSNRGGKSTLNIYTINTSYRPFGWARWPWDFDQKLDGVVVGYQTLPGGALSPFNQGDTTTHEVGHWLGLYHTFEKGCNSPGDEVEDTPPERGPTKNCPWVAPNTCDSDQLKDSVDNFMNYTDDECMYRFTEGQALRMDRIHWEHRTGADS